MSDLNLYFEIIHNLVIEVTKLGVENHNLKMKVESLSSRLDFDERRGRALEGTVQYRQPRQHQPQHQANISSRNINSQPARAAAPPPMSPAPAQAPAARPDAGRCFGSRRPSAQGEQPSVSPVRRARREVTVPAVAGAVAGAGAQARAGDSPNAQASSQDAGGNDAGDHGDEGDDGAADQ
jgi:hypothetical protein